MTVEAWVTLAVVCLCIWALVRNLAPPDAVFLGAVVVLACAGVLNASEAFAGFSNQGVITIAAMFVVAAAMRETGLLRLLGERLLGRARSEMAALVRIAAAVLPASAVVNNTPVVAMMVPMVLDWCRRWRVPASRLLIPVSYFAILGGTWTLIGTSTNLIVDGMMRGVAQTSESGSPVEELARGMGMFEIGLLGLPVSMAGVVYILLVGRRLLPYRKELLEQLGEQRREYLVEMLVEPHCRLVGKTVEEAGLRHLPGLFLIEIEREGRSIAPVGPEEVIRAGDRLILTGIVSTIVDLERIPGLVPAADSSYVVSPDKQRGRRLCEVVVSPTSPLVGMSIREANFRALYNAAVVAVHRSGRRIPRKIGDIVLQPGDTLLLQVGAGFARAHRNNPDFYLVSDVEDSRPYRTDRAWVAVLAFVLMIVAMTTGLLPPPVAALLGAGAMVAGRCISVSDARHSLDWQTLVAIAAALGVGAAMERSGLASLLAHHLVEATAYIGPLATLAAITAATVVVTELVTNNAAAVLMFPIAVHAATELSVNPRPFVMALAVAASASFASPVGYQTNMIVYGPGGYRFADFLKVGLLMDVLVVVLVVLLAPLIWPL